MRAFILAAGLGKRMGELTADRPKAMISFAGEPLLKRQVSVLKAAGINDLVIVGGYQADKLKELGLPLIVNERYDKTNMVYSLFCAAEEMRAGEDLVITYGDIIYEKWVLEALLSCQAPLCIVVDENWREYWASRMADPLEDAETLKLENGNSIIELGKKAKDYTEIQGQYIGLIKVAGEYVELFKQAWYDIEREGFNGDINYEKMFMTSYLQYLINIGWKARAVRVSNGWLEFDTLEDLRLYESLHKEGRLKQFYSL